MKKFLLLSILIIASASTVFANKITVHGTVLNAKDKTPIVGAMVKDKTSDSFTTTDVDGTYTITVEQGSKLEFSSVGYRTKEVKAKSPLIDVSLSWGKDKKFTSTLSLVGGPLQVDNSFENNFNAGLLCAVYKKSWGFYVKPVILVACKDSHRSTWAGMSATFGAIKNITDNFRVFFGTGFGMNCYGYRVQYDYPNYQEPPFYTRATDDDYEYEFVDEVSKAIGVPLEVGLQYNYKRLHLSAGYQYLFNVSTHLKNSTCNQMVFFGVGCSI